MLWERIPGGDGEEGIGAAGTKINGVIGIGEETAYQAVDHQTEDNLHPHR